MTVHLVNLTNPMMMKGPVREVIPAPKQRVRVRLPSGRRAAKVQLLVAQREIPYRQDESGIDLDVPSIVFHEVVAIDFAS
ncbi:MAG TPA: hypothetical protein VG206_13320, partial [Terriglobia bacterium]|nr:hypothetical protein [Terriglobia bacterium]